MANTEKIDYLGGYIDGKFSLPDRVDGEFVSSCPADLQDHVIDISFGLSQVDTACEVAKRAYPGWAELDFDDRKKFLLKLKNVFSEHETEIAEVISRDTGKPLWEAKTEAKALVSKIDVTINDSVKYVAEERLENALPGVDGVTRYFSRGVMAVLGPFNFPAHLPNGHIIPALLMGNTVVFKPSEHTPAVGQLYTELFHKAEFPPGVFNLVQGNGESGRRLATNELVDGVLFTGSYEVGLKIKQETMRHYWKILALEMGGKNATVVWNDADIEKAVYETIVGAYLTTGQRCSCTSRVILHKDIHEKFLERFYSVAKKISIGHWSENPFMGPLINSDSVDKYIRFQEIARHEGAEQIMRGKVLELKHKGYYVTPSIFQIPEYNPDSVYQKSEIFGPNVSVFTVDDFDRALDMVSSTGFGLAMSFFGKSEAMFKKALLHSRVGLLNWNRTTNGASSRLPFGGLGKSGNDRPSGSFAIKYCSVPVASLEDHGPLDETKILPGIDFSRD